MDVEAHDDHLLQQAKHVVFEEVGYQGSYLLAKSLSSEIQQQNELVSNWQEFVEEAQGVVQVEERCGLHQEVRRTSLGINEVTDFLREAKAKDLSVLNFPNEFLVSKILTQLHESSNGVL